MNRTEQHHHEAAREKATAAAREKIEETLRELFAHADTLSDEALKAAAKKAAVALAELPQGAAFPLLKESFRTALYAVAQVASTRHNDAFATVYDAERERLRREALKRAS